MDHYRHLLNTSSIPVPFAAPGLDYSPKALKADASSVVNQFELELKLNQIELELLNQHELELNQPELELLNQPELEIVNHWTWTCRTCWKGS
jgi:hypothetical protein